MDVAFQSRIQVAIEYDALTSKLRSKVWSGLLDSRSSTIDPSSLENIRDKVLSLVNNDLNGRQIRNVLNVAEGLAFNEFGEPGMMNYSHVLKAVRAAKEFQKFFDKARSKARDESSVWAPYNGSSDDDNY
jgi:hypothetical protein